MNTVSKLAVAVLFAAPLLGGCTFIPGMYPSGIIYNGTTTPHGLDRLEMAGPEKTGDRTGEACVSGILSLVAWGDASVDAAKKDGVVTDVESVEFKSFTILGIYSQGCTQVHGK